MSNDSSLPPLLVSRPTVLSFWAEYRIYADRLELDTQVFGLITIPFAHLEQAAVRPAVAILDLVRGDHGLRWMGRSAKLDLADLSEHVAVERSTGLFRQLRLTPEDPHAFVATLQAAQDAWRQAQPAE